MLKQISILLVALIFILASCNSNDNEIIATDDTVTATIDLAVSVKASFYNATITWDLPSSQVTPDLTYDLRFNGEILVSGISPADESYFIDGLQMNTSYSVDVIARNTFGESTASIAFFTLDLADFPAKTSKIRSFDFGTQFDVRNFNYNDDYSLINSVNSSTGGVYSFNYDSAAILTDVNFGLDFTGQSISMMYEGDSLRSVLLRETDDFLFTIKTTFVDIVDPESYTATVRELDWETEEVLSEVTHSINLSLDSDDRVVYYKFTPSDGTPSTVVEFEYEGDNLSKMVINGNESEALIFKYDSNPNYFKDFPGFPSQFRLDTYDLSAFLSNQLIYIPQLMFFNNQNNLIAKTVGGVVVNEIAYEYDELGFPSKILPQTNNSTKREHRIEYVNLD